MADLTAGQSGVIDQLIAEHGEGEVVEANTSGVVYKIGERHWQIGPRGGLSELQSSAAASPNGQPESSEGELGNESSGDSQAASESAPPAADPEPPAPSSTDLTVPEDQRVYQALTAADERQIIAEIEGRALGAMVYSFKSGGQKVTGLSWKGVQEAVRQMNTRQMGRIRIAPEPAPRFEEVTVKVDGEQRKAVRCTVYAEDQVYGTARHGTATQLRELKKRDGTWIDDTFADSKALSKAQRNAMEGMLPLELVEELKQAYIGAGKVEYIDSTAVDVSEQPPALTDDRAKELGDEIRALYEEFKRTHPDGMRAMLPGEFNRLFTAVQHDHARLEDFKAFMQQRVDEAREAQEAAA